MTPQAHRAPIQLALVAAGFAVVLLMGVLSVWLIQRSQATNDRLTHALQVSNVLAGLRADIRRVESGQRGFLLTGRAAYLNDYNATRGRLLPELDQLTGIGGDQAQANAKAAALRGLIEAKLQELAQTIDLELTNRHQEAVALVNTDRGLQTMNDIADQIRLINQYEADVVAEARQSSDRTQLALFIVNLVGVLAIGGLAYGSYLIFRRNARQILAAQTAVQALNADLEARVVERTADLEDANSEIQRYTYVVTHDLRSPLVNIMGFTSELEALREDLFRRLGQTDTRGPPVSPEDTALTKLRGDFDEAIHFIKTSIAKMDGLINAILKLSRAGRRDLTIQRIDLNDLVEVISADFRHRIKESGAELVIGTLPTVRSDRMALEQVISNLIDNAIKYLRRDVPGRIVIRAEETPLAYKISVADNGRGIEAKDRERVFELFRRAGAPDRPGEGIGLAHARGLARRVGGTLGIADNPDGGTIFTLSLSKLWMARQAIAAKGEAA
jgi:signal transduction histidine kinase